MQYLRFKKMSDNGIKIEISDKNCDELKPEKCEIQYLDYFTCNYSDFFEIMVQNTPCIIKNVSNSWKCTQNWVLQNNINYEYLKNNYGDLEAPVANCESINYNAQCKSNMLVKDYLIYLQSSPKHDVLYLKDWHLRRMKPDHVFYEVPKIFASDWLNEFSLDHQEDDFMFVYMGPENSWTPFHADVYSSFSWSVNVFGKKKWILLPPGEEEKLKDALGNLPLIFEPEKYHNVKYIEVFQESGDALFVPSEWHHQVFNILPTVSVNHNFINGCNIEVVWRSLQKNLLLVEKEIQDLKDSPEFTSQCQLILKSCFGMNLESFINFVIYIGEKRLKQVNGAEYKLFNTFTLMKNHLKFDLKAISKIIGLIENHSSYTRLSQNIVSKLTNVKNSLKLYLIHYKDLNK